ncbi:MAG: MBL fold metallo-hydrolase [Cognatishimia sp.]|uniref:MBL fold metallo-hydrolase n=1 Tax=Cognatishimia sp. TaxID=2211648 RepID=UPI0040586E48
MSFTKREFLYRSMAAPLSLALPRFAQAQITLGPATLTTVSDGSLVLPGSFIFEPMPEADLDTILRDFNLSKDRLTPECNLALFRDGTRNVLFDVGSGPDFMPSAGTLVNSLDRLGMTPEDITHVVFTHAHPDHIWGLLDAFDDPLFYNATYMMGRGEWDYWWNPETVNTIGDARAAFAVGAKRRMQAIEDAVVLFEDGQEILPGILALSTPGHTPGHMAFEIRHGATAALVLGDAIGNHHVAFQRPNWESGSDQDMALAAKTRGMLFDRIMADDLAVVGFHLPNGGIGRVDRFKDGFKFIEA